MAKTVKKTKVTKAATPAQTMDQDGCLVLQGELFWKWKAADSEQRYVSSAIQLKQKEIDAILDKYPDVKALLGDKNSLIQRSIVAQNEMRNVLAGLEEHLGMSMKNVSIDDTTGKVFILSATGGEPAPVKPKARSKKNK